MHTPDLESGWVDVVAERRLAQAVAARTGIQHESPQVLLLKDGKVVWHENHWRITAARLTEPSRERSARLSPLPLDAVAHAEVEDALQELS